MPHPSTAIGHDGPMSPGQPARILVVDDEDGIADLVCQQMVREGMSDADAHRRCWLVNSRGLVTADTTGLSEFQRPFAHPHAPQTRAHVGLVERLQ